MAMTVDKQASDIFDKNRVKYLRQISEIRHTQKTDLKRERRPTEYVQCRGPYTVWTEDQVKQLTELWETDLSAREIAGELGVTKQAVIGKVRRLGLAKKRRLGLAMRRDPAMKHQSLLWIPRKYQELFR